MQYFMVSYNWNSVIFDSTPITLAMQMTAVGCGLGSWLVAICAKYIPERFFNWFNMPEDSTANKKSRFNAIMNNAVEVTETLAAESEWRKNYELIIN